jgi:hypothetical protein
MRLGEGQSVWASQALSPEQGTLLAWVQGRNWDTENLAGYPVVEVGAKSYQWIIDAAGLTIAMGQINRRVHLPRLSASLEHLIGVRWQEGKVELWLDARPVASVEEVKFLGFPGDLRCASPTKAQAPYRILAAFPFRSALSDQEMAAAFHLFGFSNSPYAVVPRADDPPRIDGVAAEGEWDRAASLAGLHRVRDRFVSTSPSLVRVTYDAERLYICYAAEPPFGKDSPASDVALMLRQIVREPDALLDTDDSLEVSVVPDYPRGAWYRLATNHANTHRDVRGEPDSPPDPSWNPRWQSATSLSENGWTVEMSIPLVDLSVSSPEPGATEWGINFRRCWRQLIHQDDEWATGARVRGQDILFPAGPTSSGPIGRIRFGDSTDLVARFRTVSGLDTGHPRLAFDVVNPGPFPRQARVRIESSCEQIQETEILEVPARQSVPFKFEGRITRPHSLWIDLTVDEPLRSRLVHHSRFSYRLKTGPECALRYYPSFDRLGLGWDLSLYKDLSLPDLVVEVQVADRKSMKVVLSQGLTGLENFLPRMRLATEQLPAGPYAVVTRVGHGKELGRTVSFFDKQSVPAWRAETLGTRDVTPPPFTPIETEGFGGVAGRKLKVLGRTYEFGHSALPEQILVHGEPILAGPMTLVCERPEKWTRDLARDIVQGLGTGNPIDLRPHEIQGNRVGWASASSVKDRVGPGVSGWAEYDGLLWFTVQVAGNEWQRLKSLRLEVPIKNEWAERVRFAGGGRSIDGPIPAHGAQTGFGSVWIGNNKGGLQWCAESDASWRLKEPGQAIQIRREQNTMLTINFIDHEVALPGGFTGEFGIMATPVRPPGASPTGDRPMAPGATEWPGAMKDTARAGNPLRVLSPNEVSESSLQDSGIVRCLHVSHCRADDSPLGREMLNIIDAYFYEWTPCQSDEWQPGLESMECCPASNSWQDFLVWLIVTSNRRQPIDVLHLFGVAPVYSDNRYAGGGLRHGESVYPKWTVLGTRALLKRIYAALQEESAKARIMLHVEGPRLAPFEAFAHQVMASPAESR